MKKNLLSLFSGVIFLSFLCSISVNAQQLSLVKELEKQPGITQVSVDSELGTPSIIRFDDTQKAVSISEVSQFLNTTIGKATGSVFVQQQTMFNNHGVKTVKFHQYINGVKVEHGTYTAVFKNDKLQAITGKVFQPSVDLPRNTTLNEATALNYATLFMGAEQYSWEYIQELASKTANTTEINAYNEAFEKYFPKGELVYLTDFRGSENTTLSLAYKFNVYAAEPIARANIYVDAANGKVLLSDAIIKHITDKKFSELENIGKRTRAQATGVTRYAGERSFDTSQPLGGDWELNGVYDGIENETRSMEGIGGLPLSLPILYTFSQPITDNDNNWTQAEHRPDDFSLPYPAHNEFNNDDVALDAHWGAEVVIRYWKEKHNRESFDGNGGKVTNFVHYGDAYDNAFWNGEAMTYGDGSAQQNLPVSLGGFLPLTSMDVCAHEIGHGVCEYTSNLVYQRESGGMNEGFSDIWAAAIEHFVIANIDNSLPYQPFGIGEQIDDNDGGVGPNEAETEALRWMDDPKAAGDPDSYDGQNWQEPECGEPTLANDYCGVHTNSGVLNKWYYLLVIGSGQDFSLGAGKAAADDQVSDDGRDYLVEGVGYDIADQITFMAETMLSPTAKFIDMREASIIAAQTLYGPNEVKAVTDAWFAVDIGEAYDAGEPNRIIFNSSNPNITNEVTGTEGCDASKELEVKITAVELENEKTITLSTDGSTAIEGRDFDFSPQEITFPPGSSDATVILTIYNDRIIEDPETVSLSFVYQDETQVQTVEINDNDLEPSILLGSQNLITEGFDDGFEIPVGWSEDRVIAGSASTWHFNGVGAGALGRAYISFGPLPEEATYDQSADANTILKTPVINAIGMRNISVSFDWEAGGEIDATDGTYFDYGEFMYSTDGGANYTSVEKYSGSMASNGAVIQSGTFDMPISELDNSEFVLGWRWFNDALLGTPYSFSIDNVSISGEAAYIELQQGASAEAYVGAEDTVFFVSQAGDVIAKLAGTGQDLGCVTVTVQQGGASDIDNFTNIDGAHTKKVISVLGDELVSGTVSYDLTLYVTEDEISEFSIPDEELQIIQVVGTNIDDASNDPLNHTFAGTIGVVDTDNAYRTFTGTFNGIGLFAVADDEPSLGVQEFSTNNAVLYPSIVNSGSPVTVEVTQDLLTQVQVFDIKGSLVRSISAQSNRTLIPTAGLGSGMYFAQVTSEQGRKTIKFLVQ